MTIGSKRHDELSPLYSRVDRKLLFYDTLRKIFDVDGNNVKLCFNSVRRLVKQRQVGNIGKLIFLSDDDGILRYNNNNI